jgi:hypothetical protein
MKEEFSQWIDHMIQERKVSIYSYEASRLAYEAGWVQQEKMLLNYISSVLNEETYNYKYKTKAIMTLDQALEKMEIEWTKRKMKSH